MLRFKSKFLLLVAHNIVQWTAIIVSAFSSFAEFVPAFTFLSIAFAGSCTAEWIWISLWFFGERLALQVRVISRLLKPVAFIYYCCYAAFNALLIWSLSDAVPSRITGSWRTSLSPCSLALIRPLLLLTAIRTPLPG